MKRIAVLIIAMATMAHADPYKGLDVTPVASATPAPAATATPTPAPTPNPARGAMQAVTEMYPDVAIKGSTFNLMFVDYYNQALKNAPPEVLASPDWPFQIADVVGQKLKIKPLHVSTTVMPEDSQPPVVTAAPQPSATPFTSDPENPLNQGPHDQHRNTVHNRPYWYWDRSNP